MLEDPGQRLAMEALQRADERLRKAREDYATAVLRANRMGLSNVAIARAVGRTETAIRMFLKRKKAQ